ncbi:MAG: serine/threonine-protein kinase [Lachnospirales bacterium]
MSSLSDEYELSQYKELETIDNKGNVYLVKDIRNNKLWVKKKITDNRIDVYTILKGVKNNNIVFVKDILNVEGKSYVIEEYIEGIDLQRYLKEKGKLSVKEVRDIMCQVCDGLYVLHNRNIIHRDIAPSNIVISNSGTIKLIDMGISRIKKEDSIRDTTILGTAGYAAPEQFGFNQTTASADIYSCGVLMNVMLTGKFPFEEKYTGAMDYIIDRCLNMEAKSRYLDASELKYALIKAENKAAKFVDRLGSLPGFRSNNSTNKFVGTIVYIIFAILLSMAFLCIALSYIQESIMYLIMDCVCVIMPFFIAADFLNYQEKLPILRNWDKIYRTIFGVVFAFIEFSVSLLFMLIWFDNLYS